MTFIFAILNYRHIMFSVGNIVSRYKMVYLGPAVQTSFKS